MFQKWFRKKRDINVTIDKVKRFHDTNENQFPLAKRFHYNSRMFLHTGGKQYKDTLNNLKLKWEKDISWYINKANSIPNTKFKKPKLDKEKQYRENSLKKHYKIRLYNKIFSKALFQEKIYNEPINLREVLDLKDVLQVRKSLIADEKSLLILSTPAVNFLYYYNFFLESKPVNPEFILRVGELQVDLDTNSLLHAKIYFYTHAIIGASRFYSEEISVYIDEYIEMLRRLDAITMANFKNVSLDQKFEILVCAKLLGVESAICDAVAKEAVNSLSAEGDFFVDRLNRIRNNKTSFVKSEHRNVLGIMAFYEPQ